MFLTHSVYRLYNQTGRFAAITNYRVPSTDSHYRSATSRGVLAVNFLVADVSACQVEMRETKVSCCCITVLTPSSPCVLTCYPTFLVPSLYLYHQMSPREYLHELKSTKNSYGGFNIVVGDIAAFFRMRRGETADENTHLWYYSNMK